MKEQLNEQTVPLKHLGGFLETLAIVRGLSENTIKRDPDYIKRRRRLRKKNTAPGLVDRLISKIELKNNYDN